MKEQKKQILRGKGWSEEEIKKAETILKRSEEHNKFLSKFVFWTVLAIIIFANLIISFVLFPFLTIINNTILYVTIGFFALTIGFLYNFLIRDISHIERKHHIIGALIIPLLALANSVVIILISNNYLTGDPVIKTQSHNPWIVGLVFAGAFILPYVFDSIRLKFKKKKTDYFLDS